MNKTIETILNHRSIRSFTDQLLSEEEIRLLVESAQSASTSSYIQAIQSSVSRPGQEAQACGIGRKSAIC